MKKKIMTSMLAALLSVSSITFAGGPEFLPPLDYFSGYYIGGIVGVHHNTFDAQSTIVLTEPIALFNIIPLTLEEAGVLNTFNFSGGNYVTYGGIQGGFGKVFWQHWYLGLQGWGEWGNDSNSNSQEASLPFAARRVRFLDRTFDTTRTAVAQTVTKTKISNDYGVAAKIGWLLAPRTMFYGKIGASWAQIKLSNSLSANSSFNAVDVSTDASVININSQFNASSSSSDTKAGLLLGLGLEQFIWEDIVSVNVEYNYVSYGDVDTSPAQLFGTTFINVPSLSSNPFGPFNTTTNVFTSASTSNIRVSQLMGGLNFYFGRDWI